MGNEIIYTTEKNGLLPEGYVSWRKEIVSLIETSKYQAVLNVNAEMLALYWKIGSDIIKKQDEQGWGTQVIEQLAKDIAVRFPDDRGYSGRNLRNMKRYAAAYPDFPFLQVPLAKIQDGKLTLQAKLDMANEFNLRLTVDFNRRT